MRLFCLILPLVSLAVAGCGGRKGLSDTSECDIPKWYAETPQDQQYFYAAATASSQDLQIAADKAAASARAEIGRQTEAYIASVQKQFDEEVGVGDEAQLLQQWQQTSKIVVSTSLSGTMVTERLPCKDGGNWRQYVLVRYPVGEAAARLMAQIKKSEQLQTRLRASQAFKELDDEVEKYEAWKQGQ